MKLSPNSLLLLSALGFGLLWGSAISTGTLDALNKVHANAFFLDGRPLRSVYTGFKSIDSALTTLVAFFMLLAAELPPVLECSVSMLQR